MSATDRVNQYRWGADSVRSHLYIRRREANFASSPKPAFFGYAAFCKHLPWCFAGKAPTERSANRCIIAHVARVVLAFDSSRVRDDLAWGVVADGANAGILGRSVYIRISSCGLATRGGRRSIHANEAPHAWGLSAFDHGRATDLIRLLRRQGNGHTRRADHLR